MKFLKKINTTVIVVSLIAIIASIILLSPVTVKDASAQGRLIPSYMGLNGLTNILNGQYVYTFGGNGTNLNFFNSEFTQTTFTNAGSGNVNVVYNPSGLGSTVFFFSHGSAPDGSIVVSPGGDYTWRNTSLIGVFTIAPNTGEVRSDISIKVGATTVLSPDGSITADSLNISGITATEVNSGTVAAGTSLSIAGQTVSPITRVNKTADQTSVDTNLQDDNELLFSIDANTKYSFHIFAVITTATADGIKVSMNGPAAANLSRWNTKIYKSDALNKNQTETTYDTTTVCTAVDAETTIEITGYVDNGANSGNLVFRWAKNADVTTDTTILKGSYMEVIKY